MLRTIAFAMLAAVCVAGAAAAQDNKAAAGFTPGPHNDPDTCGDLWKGIGLPEYAREDERDATIVCHTKYVLSHNNMDKTPDWVIEHLTKAQITGTNKRSKMKFQPEPFVDPQKRAVDDDYKNSKFDRGHQAPSDDFKANRDWMIESFYLSNIVPQVGAGFNRGIWKNLEDHVRDLVNDRGELYVVTGPVYRGETGNGKITIGTDINLCRKAIVLDPPARETICGSKSKCEDGVTVPSALYKIIYDPFMGRANAFILPNISHRGFTDPLEYLKKFQVTVQVVETLTGLEFFRDLPLAERRPLTEQCAEMMEH
jgi:endonuclease G, mitochondrial